MRSVAEALLNQACSYVTAQRVAVEHALIDSIGDSAHESIVAEAKFWRANLIVMGAHNQRGVQRPLGTEAGAVLRKAPIPVLLVRSGSAAAHQPIVLASGAALRLVAAH
jgi:nucleotide-binding universal stress UspA family protein